MEKVKVMKIENYIFDFGGVLYKIAPIRTIIEFCRLSGLPVETLSRDDLY